MAKHIVAPVGISGAGKSTLYKNRFPTLTRICPDELRKALTGDISNQSRNREVFAAAYYMLDTILEHDDTRVFFDATNLDSRAVDALKAARDNSGAILTFVIMRDSEDLKLCKERVGKDISGGVDRSNTLVKDDILPTQQGKYYAAIEYIKSLAKRFDGIRVVEYQNGQMSGE